jgi:plasmid stability protein
MAQLIVRNLEDTVLNKIRKMAQSHGWSMEEEVRDILRAVVASDRQQTDQPGLGTRISQRFADCNLGDDFQIPEWRGLATRPASFES